jgi:hypothetical protein
MGMMQRVKGATGEREVAHLFQQNGFMARRGGMGQAQASHLAPDVVVEKLPFLWVEVKRQAQTRPLQAIEQSDEALSKGKFEKYKCAVCFTRNNNEDWQVWARVCDLQELKLIEETVLPVQAVVCMPPDNFFSMLRNKYGAISEQPELPIK